MYDRRLRQPLAFLVATLSPFYHLEIMLRWLDHSQVEEEGRRKKEEGL
jgi:hypothetical protein